MRHHLTVILAFATAATACGHGRSIEGDADASEARDTLPDPIHEPDVPDLPPDPATDPVMEDPVDEWPCTEPPPCPSGAPPSPVVGGACTSDVDCAGSTCINEIVDLYGGERFVEWMGGSCVMNRGTGTSGCSLTDPTWCPSGGRCTLLGSEAGEDVHGCVQACKATDTSWNPYDWNCGCRRGYRCDITTEACLPGCSNDLECCIVWDDLDGDGHRDEGEVQLDGDCTNWCDGDDPEEFELDGCMASFACVNEGDPAASCLSPCLFDSDCPADYRCQGEPLFPEGLCTKDACHLIGRGCEEGCDCVNLGSTDDPDYRCAAGCETGCFEPGSTDNPCHHPDRTNPYVCSPFDPTRWFPASSHDGLCFPATVPSSTTPTPMYEACTADTDCASPHGLGICLELMEKPGFCGAYCNENLAETCTICGAAPSPGDVPPGVCALGLCLPSCDTVRGDVGDNGCPTGTGLPDFACYPGDGSYGGSIYLDPAAYRPPGFCIPACATTADCGLLWTGVVSCNTTSGVCG